MFGVRLLVFCGHFILVVISVNADKLSFPVVSRICWSSRTSSATSPRKNRLRSSTTCWVLTCCVASRPTCCSVCPPRLSSSSESNFPPCRRSTTSTSSPETTRVSTFAREDGSIDGFMDSLTAVSFFLNSFERQVGWTTHFAHQRHDGTKKVL